MLCYVLWVSPLYKPLVGLILELGSGLYYTSNVKAFAMILWVCSTHLQLKIEPGICVSSFANLGDPLQLCELSTFCESQEPFKSVSLTGRMEFSQSFSHLCRFIVLCSEEEVSREQREKKSQGCPPHAEQRFCGPFIQRNGLFLEFQIPLPLLQQQGSAAGAGLRMGMRERRRRWDFPLYSVA